MHKVTLGGDRLSSGKKMTVNLKAYERSSHNKGFIWRNTQSPGTLVPFFVQVATPGSTLDIDLDCDIMTHPTVGPLFGSFKVDLHIFQCPIRLYNSWLHNNRLKIGMNMSAVKLPLYSLVAPISSATETEPDNTQINPSCLLAYLGVRGIGIADEENARYFNAVPLIAYWDIYKNYYANKQEEIGAYIRGSNNAITETVDSITINGTALPEEPASPIVIPIQFGTTVIINYTGTTPIPSQIRIRIVGIGGDQYYGIDQLSNNLIDNGTTLEGTVTNFVGNSALSWKYETANDIPLEAPIVSTFDLDNIDTLREEILASNGGTAFLLNTFLDAPYAPLLAVTENGRNPRLNTQEGLAVKTYQSDLFNNWLNTEWIDGAGGIAELSAITVTGGQFTLDQLLMGRKIYDLLNRIGVSGGTYKDWIEAAYTKIDWTRAESPVYCGGLIKELVFQEVVSNSATEGQSGLNQPLGTLAGKGVLAKKHKGGKIVAHCDEHSYFIGLVSLTPRIDYSQGNSWDSELLTMDDFHKPAFDEIGFQELPTNWMAWWSSQWNPGTSEWDTPSAGKQPAWIHYMTEVNKTYGNFAIENNEMFMTLNRRYEYSGSASIEDLTTYIDPAKYNFIFAETSIDAMNFWVQIAVDFTYRAKMSGKLMPNL